MMPASWGVVEEVEPCELASRCGGAQSVVVADGVVPTHPDGCSVTSVLRRSWWQLMPKWVTVPPAGLVVHNAPEALEGNSRRVLVLSSARLHVVDTHSRQLSNVRPRFEIVTPDDVSNQRPCRSRRSMGSMRCSRAEVVTGYDTVRYQVC